MNPIPSATDDLTLGQRAYQELRNSILSGQLAPGKRLSLRNMAQALGMSIAPVGEAFRELARDGLIETESRWGTRVRRLDLAGMRNQHILRTAIECEAIRQCTQPVVTSHVDELAGIASELDERVARNDDPEEIFQLDARFHQRLCQASGFPLLTETLKATQLMRLLAHGSRIAHGRKSPPRQHQLLVEAIRSGDADAAERTMREHCVHSMLVQLEFFAAAQAADPGGE
jgi:DNA-binding GntR family transcriptional regulator